MMVPQSCLILFVVPSFLKFCFSSSSLVILRGLQDLSSLMRDGISACCGGSVESSPLDHQGIPKAFVL